MRDERGGGGKRGMRGEREREYNTFSYTYSSTSMTFWAVDKDFSFERRSAEVVPRRLDAEVLVVAAVGW